MLGTKGEGNIRGRVSISGESPWRYKGEKNDMYQTEHNEIFASIRVGEPINDGDRMMTSTIAAIMGREAAYTGKQLTWEQAMASDQTLIPTDLHDWNTVVDIRPLPRPGVTAFV